MTRSESTRDAAVTVGLRERSKARRRAALQLAAMQLFAERGYEQTTLADIADVAEVAPRTIAGYFASKADLATSVGDDIVTRLIATHRANPDATYLEIIDAWLTVEEQHADGDLARLAEAMYRKNPALRAVNSAHSSEVVGLAEPLLEAQLGLPATDPMFVIARSTLGSAISAYLSTIADKPATPAFHTTFMDYLSALIDTVRNLRPPRTRRRRPAR